MTTIKISISDLIEAYHKNEESQLMKEIIWQLEQYSEEWECLVYDLNVFKPKCDVLGYCPEKKGCGRKGKKKNVKTNEGKEDR